MPLLSATHLTCRRGGRFVFANLDLAADAADAVVLTGRNGSGKSSLLRILAGLLPPYVGQLLWNGQPIDQDQEAHRTRVTYVGHQDAIKAALTVRENLALMAGLCAEDHRLYEVDKAMRRMSLSGLADTPGRYLSSGQKRRTALARLLLSKAPLWLLDEPTVGLDRESCAALATEIGHHRSRGGMVIYATHVPLDVPEAHALDLNRFQQEHGQERPECDEMLWQEAL